MNDLKKYVKRVKSKKKSSSKNGTKKEKALDKTSYFYGPYRSDFFLQNQPSLVTQNEDTIWASLTEIITDKNSSPYDNLIESMKGPSSRCKKRRKNKSAMREGIIYF